MKKLLALICLLSLWTSLALGQEVPNHSVPVGRGPGVIGYGFVGPCTAGQTLVFQGPSADPLCGAGGGGGGGAVSSVSNADGTLTISPVTGAVVASANYTGLAFTAPAHQFLNRFSNGFFAAQPAAADISGLGTIATQNASAVAITGGTITGLPMPTVGTDAATKSYVDANISGFKIHQPVALATTAALPAYTFSATGGGTLTATANAILSIDGTVVTAATRVLVKNELSSGTACNGNINSACDGVYIVNQVGTAGTPYILQRSSTNNSAGLAENVAAGWAGSDSVSVTGGATNGGSVWVNTSIIATLNLTPFNFVQFTTATGGGVTNVSNSNGTLTISPTSGVVVASLNLNNTNTWLGVQTFPNGSLTNAELASASITVNGVTCTLGATCTIATTSAGRINIPPTGNFFAPTAIVNNINDRLMVGGATSYDGTCCTDTGSWLGVLSGTMDGSANPLPAAQLGVLTDNTSMNASNYALVAAARSLNATAASTSIISIFAIAVNNNTTQATSAWGMYIEAWRFNSTVSQTNGLEVETRNLGNEIAADPFIAGGFGMSPTISSGCGAGQPGSNPCPISVLIFANQQPFDSGLMYSATAVKSRSGVIHAIDMPTMYQIVWMSSANQIAGYIWVGNGGTFNITSTDGTIALNGTFGVTCTGINTGTFRSFGGLVTHC